MRKRWPPPNAFPNLPNSLGRSGLAASRRPEASGPESLTGFYPVDLTVRRQGQPVKVEVGIGFPYGLHWGTGYALRAGAVQVGRIEVRQLTSPHSSFHAGDVYISDLTRALGAKELENVGTALVGVVMEYAVRRGATRVGLLAVGSSHVFWHKMGFEPTRGVEEPFAQAQKPGAIKSMTREEVSGYLRSLRTADRADTSHLDALEMSLEGPAFVRWQKEIAGEVMLYRALSREAAADRARVLLEHLEQLDPTLRIPFLRERSGDLEDFARHLGVLPTTLSSDLSRLLRIDL